jgi:pantoate--beta-alanine ligase
MILFKRKTDLSGHLANLKSKGARIGFVPTMGALHQGHLSLIETSTANNSITVCSIFVNPTQFNDPADFEKYPVTIDQDILALEKAGCDILFLPGVEEVYGIGPRKTEEHYDLGYLETVLEGKYRPGHFQGVCMVVRRLLDIVNPDELYLGQKDYQQCMVITRLVELMQKKASIRVNICPTLREEDGLAMSSRNLRLSTVEREHAPAIYRSLQHIKARLAKGNLQPLKQVAQAELEGSGFRVDYVEIADALTLELVEEWDENEKIVALVAAFLNQVRLIDNLLLN